MSDNMVAIKIGDVNSSVIANSLMNADERSSGALIFDVTTQATQRTDGTEHRA